MVCGQDNPRDYLKKSDKMIFKSCYIFSKLQNLEMYVF